MSVRRSDAAVGKRDQWVVMVPVTDARAVSGFPTETDAAGTGVWAARDDISGRERIVMDQKTAPYDRRWIVPFADAWDPEAVDVPKRFWLTHKGRRYDIVTAAPIGRRDSVELLTLARQG